MNFVKKTLSISAFALLGACTTFPEGPSVMSLPGTGKDFGQFQLDDNDCRAYAFNQIGGNTANKSSQESGLKTAAIGTAIGAVAGALIGGSDGAAVGAGAGLIFGGVAGSQTAERSAYGSQRAYDRSYVQCMYGKGHKVPVSGSLTQRQEVAPAAPSVSSPSSYPPPPPSSTATHAVPRPPSGNPPPPPPGVN